MQVQQAEHCDVCSTDQQILLLQPRILTHLACLAGYSLCVLSSGRLNLLPYNSRQLQLFCSNDIQRGEVTGVKQHQS